MADPHIATVIKPGGIVIFDKGLAPEHRRVILGSLVEDGHTLTHIEGPHAEHGGASHAVLITGPYSAGEIEATKDQIAEELLARDDVDALDEDVVAAARARLAARSKSPATPFKKR